MSLLWVFRPFPSGQYQEVWLVSFPEAERDQDREPLRLNDGTGLLADDFRSKKQQAPRTTERESGPGRKVGSPLGGRQ